jgi:PLP dependent protein
MSPIAANLQAIRRRISEALQGDSRAVCLVAVSKSQPAEAISEAFDAGVRDFGENYLQDALQKIAALGSLGATWHFIGHLQANKAREIAQHFDWVHGVDRLRIAEALSRGRADGGEPLQICIQVNISGEGTKGGVEPRDAQALAREVSALPRLRLRGLMGMASFTDDAAVQRAQFATLARVKEEIVAGGIALDTLSMGMSQDFEAALAEGSTMVRIGTAIFGERKNKKAA